MTAHAQLALRAPAGARGRTAARPRARAANARWVSTSRTSAARCDGRVDASRAFPGSNGRVKRDVHASAIEVRPDVPTRRRARARNRPYRLAWSSLAPLL